jgi:hypothetical protein
MDPAYQLLQRLVMGIKKGGALKQVTGRIPAEGEFREHGQVAARISGPIQGRKDTFAVAGKGTDNRICLNKGDFQIGFRA